MAATTVFGFQKLHVYQLSLELVVLVDRLAPVFREARRHLGWQLHRACTSILLNIAEGNGRRSAKERAQFFFISTGSAMECAAILDIADRLEVGPLDERQQARALLERIVPMLIQLSRSVRGSERNR